MSDDRPSTSAKRSGEVSAVGLRVLEVLEKHTRFPWPLLKAQCWQHSFDPASLTREQAISLIGDLARALGALTSEAVADQARTELRAALEDA